ncbi:PAS domain-containing protein [Roseospira navarrensis]|uniref:PAS domain-containing protein n=1 Tax=Roseospira navarrensis TaxID=140058 RepID=A0A7X2D401_9PROT|nr:PAS domain-containing protein [Roseospira navarrensis]MQX37403.1 PAS domain-containing protein [Roseospira navarrensis]
MDQYSHVPPDSPGSGRQGAAFWSPASVLTAALRTFSTPVSIKDAAGTIRMVNEAMTRLLGRLAAEVEGRTARDVFPADIASVLEQDDRTVLIGGRTVTRDQLLPTRRGLVWVEVRKDPIIEDGVCVGVLTAMREISDHMEDLHRLRRSTGLLDRFFSQSLYAVACLDRRLTAVRVNEAYARLTGHDAADFIDRALFEVAPDDELEAICRRVLATGAPFRADARPVPTIRGDGAGSTFWDVSIQPIRDAAGVIDGLTVTLVDVTERKAAEAALHQSEHDKALILASISDMVAFFEHDDLRMTWTNVAAGGSVGTDKDALCGRPCHAVWGERDGPCPGCPVLEAFRTGQPADSEQTTPDGRVWSIRAFPVQDEAGGLKGVVEVGRDITDRKQADAALQRSLENLNAFFSLSRDLLAVVDADGRIVEANQTLLDRLGWTRAALIGQPMAVLRPADRQAEADTDLRDMQAGRVEILTHPLATSAGRPVQAETRIARGTWNGAPVLFTASRDLSALALSEEKFKKAFTNNATLMAITDPETGRFVEANEALLHVIGQRREAVIGRTSVELGLFPTQTIRNAMTREAARPGAQGPVEFRFTRPDGRPFIGEMTGHLITSGETPYMLTMVTDVTRQRELMAELEHRATHDGLTGLRNRQQGNRDLDQEAARAERMGTPLALVMIDVDHFKTVNDTLGHPGGDQVLREVSRRLKDRLREIDRLARWGGEEFVAILPGTDAAGALHLAETLRAAMAEATLDGIAPVTISLGVAVHRPGQSVAEWVTRADAALYAAKAAGRNCVRMAD